MVGKSATKPSRPRSRPDSLSWIGKVELLSFTLLLSGVFVFLCLAHYAGLGEVHELDRRILLLFRNATDTGDPIGPEWFEELVRDFTALGGHGALTFLTLAVAGGLALAKKGRTAVALVAAIAGGFTLSLGLKALFQRARPDLVPHGAFVASSSFPSAHSMLSMVAYLTLGAVLARVQSTRIFKVYVVALVGILTLLIGLSRIYLGLHWPSDVVAGWSAGVVWAMAVWLVTRRFQHQGTIEAEPVEHEVRA